MAIGIKVDGGKSLKNIKIDGKYIDKVKVDGHIVWKRDNWVDKTGELARRDIPVRTGWVPWAESTSGEAWCEVLTKQTVSIGKTIRVKTVYIHCDLIRTEPSAWNPDWSFTMKFSNSSTGESFEVSLSANQPDLKYGFSQDTTTAQRAIAVDTCEYWGSINSNPASKHNTSGYLSVTAWQEEGS